jgi:hypothetical protein
MLHLSPTDVGNYFENLGISSKFGATEVRELETQPLRQREGFMTFPTPRDNEALTVLGLREQLGGDPEHAPSIFDHSWYLEESFGKVPCVPGWHQLAMDVWPDSTARPVYHAEDLKREALYLPTATEVLLMLFLNFARNGERLLLRKHTWTRDRTETTEAPRFVSIGAFGKKGVFVSSHEVGYKSRGLGICPAADPFS